MSDREKVAALGKEIGMAKVMLLAAELWREKDKQALTVGPPANQTVDCFCASEYYRGDPAKCDCCNGAKWLTKPVKNIIMTIQRKVAEADATDLAAEKLGV